jgi:hypothetical protein
MTSFYLNQYLPLLAFAILTYASVRLYRSGNPVSAALIGVPSIAVFLIKIMTDFIAPQSMEYVYGPDGEVLGAQGAFTFWQNAMFWVYPLSILSISAGVLLLSRQLDALNKQLS